MPGVVGVLARITARPEAPTGARALHDDAQRWLAAQRDSEGHPAAVHGDRRELARTAWCYSDPGIAAALQTPDPAWLGRPFESTLVVDAGLRPGAAGLMHLANRMYQATRDVRFRDEALRWLRHTLALGLDGLPDGTRGVELLSGTIGVGLALLAMVSDLEPAWDRLLLCDR